MIVDSTRKGKRFADSMSKTIPIWTCVLNRAIANYRSRSIGASTSEENDSVTSSESADFIEESQDISGWDCSLHLPLWVSATERALIESRLEGWTNELEASGADIASLASSLEKPLRPLWISQKTVIWLNEVPEYDSWDFTPIMLVSTSALGSNFRTTSEFSWNYIAGAGDDEESWARGLSPELFWKHVYDLISSSPNLCNQKVADIVEKDRVFRSQRGELAPQVSIKPSKSSEKSVHLSVVNSHNLDSGEKKSPTEDCDISFLGSTNLAVGASQFASVACAVDCILNCDKNPLLWQSDPDSYLHLPIVGSKFDRFDLVRYLPCAMDFAKTNLRKGKRLLICCSNGEDISICVCLAILTSLYDDRGQFDDGKSFNEAQITKLELRRQLVLICKFAVNARPSRGNLKQVFNYLNGGTVADL